MTHTEHIIARLRDTAGRGVSAWGDLQMEAADALEAALRTELSAAQAEPAWILVEDPDEDESMFYSASNAEDANYHASHDGCVAVNLYTTPPLSAQAEPVYVQLRHKTEYGTSEWGVPLDPKHRHSTWADGVEMRLLYTTPPSPSIGGDVTDTYVQKVPDKCDRITWRGNYHGLPLAATTTKQDAKDAERLEKSHEIARQLLTVATWAAGKIIGERKRGYASAPHAEVDALVHANEAIRAWLIKTGWSGGVESTPTLDEIAAIASTKEGKL